MGCRGGAVCALPEQGTQRAREINQTEKNLLFTRRHWLDGAWETWLPATLMMQIIRTAYACQIAGRRISGRFW